MPAQRDTGGAEAPGWFWKHGLWMVGLAFLLSALLATLVDMDPRLSGYFYDPTAAQQWFLKTAVPWIWLYRYGEWPTWVLAIGAVVVWGGSLRRRSWVYYRRACALIVLAIMLGPGLLVNGVLKPLWGRPRPAQTELFGGSRPYQPWWQPGHSGGGRSFPSGHAAMGYVLVLGICLVPRRRSAWLRGFMLGGALAYGSLLGATRIIQGGHFLSDVLWSGSLMCFLVATLQAVLPTPTSPNTDASQNPPTVFNAV
jgi:membrane-associated PAP2 superfamily phosphatase